jgi:hypothetical protein
MIDATGTRRRMQALAALGYTRLYLASRLGWNRENVYNFTRGDQTRVYLTTAERVKKIYDELSMNVPEDTRSRKVARTYSRKSGFVLPLAWDESEIDDCR